MIGALLITWNAPAVAYESSIYTGTPLFLWISLFLNLFIGMIIIVNQVAYKGYKNSNAWLLGFFLILLSYTVFLALWIIRGYALWNDGDPALHFGMMKYLMASGHLDLYTTIYPALYLYIVQLSLLTGISLTAFHKIIPLISAVFYVFFMFLIFKMVLPDKGQILLATIASMTIALPVSYISLTPNYEANLFLPIALFVLLKSHNISSYEWKIMFIIMILLMPLFHPIVGILFLVAIFGLWFPGKILNFNIGKINQKFKEPLLKLKYYFQSRDTNLRIYSSASLLLLVWIFTWASSFYSFKFIIINTKRLLLEGGPNELQVIKGLMDYTASVGYNPYLHIFQLYGDVFIYLIFAVIAFFLLFKKMDIQEKYRNLVLLFGPLTIISALTGLFYFANFGFGNQRLFPYIVILATPFVGFVLFEFINGKYSNVSWISRIRPKFASLIVVVIFMGMFLIPAVSVYDSSYTYVPNWQITKTNLDGYDWFLHQKDTKLLISAFTFPTGRYANLILSQEEQDSRKDIPASTSSGLVSKNLFVKYHFGYENKTYLGEWYKNNLYLIITSKDRVVYSEVNPQLATLRFLPQDFERLEKDTSVDKFYSNGGFDAFYVHGLNLTSVI